MSMNTPESFVALKGLGHLKFSDLKKENGLRDVLLRKCEALDHRQHSHRILEEHVRALSDVLQATLQGEYNNLSALAFARVLIALDYFINNKDRTPDSHVGGFNDDLQEISRVMNDFKPEFDAFKQWRLRRQ